jgi:hypothetical protein
MLLQVLQNKLCQPSAAVSFFLSSIQAVYLLAYLLSLILMDCIGGFPLIALFLELEVFRACAFPVKMMALSKEMGFVYAVYIVIPGLTAYAYYRMKKKFHK